MKFYYLILLTVIAVTNLQSQDERYYQQIDLNNTGQTIYGWGISSAFHPAKLIYDRIPENVRDSIYDMMFTQKGADLSIFRTQIEPEYDYNSWGEDVDKYQFLIMQEAKNRGVKDFLATPWTPPGEFKANGVAAPGEDEDALSKNYLLPEKYQDYADYLVRYIKGYKEHRDIDFVAFSLQNEPDMNYIWNTCFFYPGMLADLVNVVGKTFEDEGIDLLFLAPEGGGWDLTKMYTDTIFADKTAGSYLDGISTHGYKASGQRSNVAKLAADKGLREIWQTESSDYNPNITEAQDGIDNGLLWANTISLDIKEGGTTAWFYWWMVVFSAKDGQGLMRWSNNELTTAKRFWAMAHYSRYIKKGWKLVKSVDNNTNPLLNSTVFLSPNEDSVAIVMINNTHLPLSISFLMPMLCNDLYITDLWLTDADVNFSIPTESYAIAASNALRFDSVPPRSITTAVCAIPKNDCPKINLISPSNDEYLRVGVEFIFEWDAVDCDKYELIITESPDLSEEKNIQNFELTQTTFKYIPEEYNAYLYWQVNAIKTNNGKDLVVASSDPGYFNTYPEPPGLVKILKPKDNDSVDVGEELTFIWLKASPDDISYNIVVSKSEDINNTEKFVLDSIIGATLFKYSGFSQADTYYWAVAAGNIGGFGEFTEMQTIKVVTPVGIEDNDQNNTGIEVYPNPSHDFINYILPFSPEKVKIIDNFGRVVKEVDMATSHIEIGDLPTGVYILCFENKSEIYYERFIKY